MTAAGRSRKTGTAGGVTLTGDHATHRETAVEQPPTADPGAELTGHAAGTPSRRAWQLVLPHRERLLAIAARRCPSVEDAEDCVQDALIQVAARPRLEEAEVGRLLTTVVMRRAADLWRRRGREATALARGGAEAAAAGSPEDIAVGRLVAGWLGGEARRLSRRERDVLAGCAGGLGVGETAAVLQISYKSAESALSRARAALRLVVAAAGAAIVAPVRRGRRAPAFAGAVALTSTVVIGLGVAGPSRPGPGRPPAASAPFQAATRVAARAVTGLVVSDPGRWPVSEASTPRRGVRRPAASGRPTRTVAWVRPIGNPAVVGTTRPVTVVYYDENESLLDSAAGCLSRGPSLGLGSLGCPPSGRSDRLGA